MIKKILTASISLLAMSSLGFATAHQWTSGGFGQFTLADGSALPSSFTFQIGSFGGFSPTASNFSDWGANFNTSGLDASVGTWSIAQGAFGSFTGTTTVRPGGPSGEQAFIWGYDSLDIGTVPNWVLISNESWVFGAGTPQGTPPDTPTAWQTTDEGTYLVFGGAFNHAGLAGSVNAQERLLSAQAIPEPSTYALIFGLGILGFLGYRRVRK